MTKKKTSKTEISNEVFELGIVLALSPLNFLLRKLPYTYAVTLSVLTVITWCMPVIIFFSLISNTIFVLEILFKLLRK